METAAPPLTTRLQGFIILTLIFRREEKSWVGICAELGTSTYGRSLSKVHDELKELAVLHLNALQDAGEREQFFKEHGIEFFTDGDNDSPARIEVPVDEDSFVHAHRIHLPA